MLGSMDLAPHAFARPRPHPVNHTWHDAARREDISWMSLIRTARVSYAFQLIVAAGLLLPPQMRDMLAALAETTDIRAWAAFPASMAVFGFLCWYWARATLSARFDLPDTKQAWDEAVEGGHHGTRPFVRNAPLHIVPQAPIPIAGVTGLLLALQSGALWLGLATLGALLLVWFLVDNRRRIRGFVRRTLLRHHHFTEETLPHESVRLRSTYNFRIWLRRAPFRFRKIMQRAPSGPWPAGLLLGLSLLVFGITACASYFPAERQDDPRNLIWTMWHGPTPVLLGCALMVGPLSVLSFVLDGLRVAVWIRAAPVSLSRPPVILTLLLMTIFTPGIVDLHAIRTVPGELPVRPTLGAQWVSWQAACGHGTRPIVVAVSGGAARAALWGAAVLAEIDSAAAGGHAAIFAVSSVSGGSLGTAAYLSARAANPAGQPGSPSACALPSALAPRFATYAKTLGAADAIGPLLAGVVLSDLPRALFGWVAASLGAPMRGGDRAAAIERAFETHAARAARRARLAAVPLDAPYLSLARAGLPLWIGVATEQKTGGPVLLVPVQGGGADWPFDGAGDLLSLAGADVPISTAINVTARFPFLEPVGVAPSARAGEDGARLIDGGYYDQSGLEPALELAEWLRRQGADPILVAATGSGYGNGLGTRGKRAPTDDIVRCGTGEFRPGQPPMTGIAADFLAPIMGLYQVRAGHVETLLRRVRNTWCGPAQRFFHFYLGAKGADPVPLNWVLSKPMADHVWLSAGLADPGAEAADVFVRANRCEATRLAATARNAAALCAND
jgi:hypothetical protein